jgi:branched-chain amino acid transport system substrate-binding protein
MLKKGTTVILIIMLLLVVVGCGTQSSSSNEDIKIGFYGPITGPTSLVGGASQLGARFAVDEINAKGGINGRKLKLIEYDDKSQPELAVKAVTRMIEVDKVHAIIGSLHSGNILASAPQVEKGQIPEIGIGTSSVWLSKGYKYLFRGTSSAALASPLLAKTIKEFGYTKIAILASSTEYAKTGADEIVRDLEKVGIKVVARETHNNGDTDFTAQIAKMISSGAQAMFVYSGTEDMGLQMKQFRQLGFNGEVFGPETFSSPDVRKVAGPAANGAIFAATYVIPDSVDEAYNDYEKKFLTAWKAKHGQLPVSDTAYRSYDSIMLLAEALKKTKSLNGPDLRDAIENITNYAGLAGTFNFKGNNGEGVKEIRLYGVVNGKIVPLQKYKEIVKK